MPSLSEWKTCSMRFFISDAGVTLYCCQNNAFLLLSCFARQIQCTRLEGLQLLLFFFFCFLLHHASGCATSKNAENMLVIYDSHQQEGKQWYHWCCTAYAQSPYCTPRIFCMRISKGFGVRVSKQSPASGLACINRIHLLLKWLLRLAL